MNEKSSPRQGILELLNYFTFGSRIPIVDATGKINKKELPPVRLFSEEDIDVSNFADEKAKVIAKIWCQVLKICGVDEGDNFFDLGG